MKLFKEIKDAYIDFYEDEKFYSPEVMVSILGIIFAIFIAIFTIHPFFTNKENWYFVNSTKTEYVKPIWFTIICILIVFFIITLFIRGKYLRKSKIIRKREDEFLSEYALIIQFMDSTSIHKNLALLNKIKDNKHRINEINVKFIIKGTDYSSSKEYIGQNTSEQSTDGIINHISGGSQIDYNQLGIKSYDFTNNQIKETTTKISKIEQRERDMLLKIPFYKAISKNEKFKIKFEIKHWFGAMRTDNDFIILDSHVFFEKDVDKVTIEILFKKGVVDDDDFLVYSQTLNSNENPEKITSPKILKIDKNHFMLEIDNPDKKKIYLLRYYYLKDLSNLEEVKEQIQTKNNKILAYVNNGLTY